jgi:hypothetical protein
MPLEDQKRLKDENKKLRKELSNLCSEVERYIVEIDSVMNDPRLSSAPKQRAQKLGSLVTRLEIAKDIARRYGLQKSIIGRRGKIAPGGITDLRLANLKLERVEKWIQYLAKRTSWPINLRSLSTEGMSALQTYDVVVKRSK